MNLYSLPNSEMSSDITNMYQNERCIFLKLESLFVYTFKSVSSVLCVFTLFMDILKNIFINHIFLYPAFKSLFDDVFWQPSSVLSLWQLSNTLHSTKFLPLLSLRHMHTLKPIHTYIHTHTLHIFKCQFLLTSHCVLMSLQRGFCYSLAQSCRCEVCFLCAVSIYLRISFAFLRKLHVTLNWICENFGKTNL